MSKKWFILVLLFALAIAAQVFFACDSGDDDDDNDDTDGNDDDTATDDDDADDDADDDDVADDDTAAPPLIPHDDYGQPCTDCHASAHDGEYTADQCLDCHSFAN